MEKKIITGKTEASEIYGININWHKINVMKRKGKEGERKEGKNTERAEWGRNKKRNKEGRKRRRKVKLSLDILNNSLKRY